MPVISNKRIANYLQGFSADPYVQRLLRAVYSKPLSRDPRYLETITDIASLQRTLRKEADRKLKEEFIKALD